MPRKSVKVVNLSEPVEDAPVPTAHSEAEGMNEVLSEIKEEAPTEPVAVEQPKPKRKARVKKEESPVEEAPQPPVEETPQSPIEETPQSPVEDKKQEKVPCPDCGKMVSAKTLKYTHKNTCRNKQQVYSGVCYQKEEPSCASQMKLTRRQEKIARLAEAAF